MLKKLFLSITTILIASVSIATATFADDLRTRTDAGTGSSSGSSSSESSADASASLINNSCDGSILGFTTWNCGVNISDDTTLKTGIWQIAANVATDIAVAAAYLVLGYVIYGGYLYTFSGGDPGKVATGRKTLTQAFIGLAIVMSANLIMSTIRIALLGGSGNLGNCLVVNEELNGITGNCVDATDATTVVTSTINWFIGIAGVVSAIFVVYGGISYITSAGDPSKLKKAKDMILYSLIGLAIVALATVITAFVSGIIRDANNSNTSYINETIISKELYETKIS